MGRILSFKMKGLGIIITGEATDDKKNLYFISGYLDIGVYQITWNLTGLHKRLVGQPSANNYNQVS